MAHTITGYVSSVDRQHVCHEIHLDTGEVIKKGVLLETCPATHIPDLSKLKNLEKLSVGGCYHVLDRLQFSADYINGDMTKLTEIRLFNIRVSGSISSLSVPNLRKLSLYTIIADDRLQSLLDTLPQNSKQLHELEIDYYRCSNYENDGSRIPDSINTLTGLEDLTIRNAKLIGTIPDLSNLSKLRWLALSTNSLEGEIPSSIGRLSNVEAILLNNNALTGSIPDSIKSLSKLEFLFLDKNKLSGPYPTDIARSLPKSVRILI